MSSFNEAYPRANLLYGVEMTQEEFEEFGLVAWNLIGNKRTRLYKYHTKIECLREPDGSFSNVVELPCNADIIEAVTYNFEDWNYTTNDTVNGDYNSQFTENYIETRKLFNSPLYIHGRYAKFERVGDYLYFIEDYGNVNIVYRGVILDEDGLPDLTEREINAISAFCAWRKKYKMGLILNNGDILQAAQLVQQEWLKWCDLARVPEYISQNDMNEILDAKSSWNRKIFNKSYKPIK